MWNQPSVERLRRGLRVVEVAAHHVDALDQQLAVVGDPDADAGQRPPDGADLDLLGRVDRRRGGRLGQPPALEDGDADAAEEVAEPGAQRRAAGDGVLHAAAERGPQLAVDEPVEEGVPQPQDRPGPPLSCARLQAIAVSAARVKIAPLPPGLGASPRPSCRSSRRPAGRRARTSGGSAPRSSSRFLTSAVWPIRARAATHSTWMNRAKTCASGRNSSVLAPSRARPRRAGRDRR